MEAAQVAARVGGDVMTVPVKAFVDFVQSIGDPDVMRVVNEWIEQNWPTSTPDEAAAMEIDMGPADEQFIWQEPLAVRFVWQPPPIRWLTLDDGLLPTVKALNTGVKAWVDLFLSVRRRFVVAVVQELLLMAEGQLLTTDFDAARPHWMPLFATLSEEFHMKWEQLIDAARGL